MDKKDTAQVLAILTAGYPGHFKGMSEMQLQGFVSLWSMQFANIPADIVLMALNKVISQKEQHPPTIAEVKKKLESVHWEAYEMIERHHRLKNLSEGELATYKRIYEETASFKFGKVLEPSIKDMLPRNKVKRLEGSVRND